MKKFYELTPAGKQRRLAKYQKERDQYGLYHGLFNCTAIADNGTVETKDGKTLHKFGFNVTPIDTDADWENGQFSWVNQLIDAERGAEVVAVFQEMKAELDAMKKNKTGKAIQLQIDFKPDAIGGISANKVYRVEFKNKGKKKAKAQAKNGLNLQPRNAKKPATTKAPAQPAISEEDLPF